MKNCPDCGEPWPEHGCPAATQERLRRELWEQAALRVERERWKAEAMAARRLLYETGRAVFSREGEMEMDAERDYATARAANGEDK